LSSIDSSDDNFSDLELFRDSIKDSRIILLGEATHGEGNYTSAKIRLVKFLHREMGFDILAIECGFYECNKAW